MKREVMFVLMLTLFLVSISSIYASEESQVESAYTCLESSINKVNCSSLKFEEKVFSFLAAGECGNELSLDNLSNECFPRSGCNLKSTSQAILALNSKANTTKAETWLLKQTASPTNIDWFLEIEVPSGATSCRITYSGSTYTINILENKKIDRNAGSSLVLAQDSYWLKIASSLYNNDIQVSCDKEFLTTLLFMKSGSSTIHVSDTVNHAGATGTTTERVDSLCFAQSGKCNYEGSLWAALALASLDYDEEVSRFMPYLITMKDDPFNQIYIPESFLYYLTGKFKTELLLKQRSGAYWEESGNRYYDTAVALLPLAYESSPQKSGSKSWLLSVQDKSGCWNNGNIRDTAFLLYSIWPKEPLSPPGKCEYSSDCPDIDCKSKWCEDGECVYEDDGSCVYEECTSNSQCDDYDYITENYCGDDSTVYRESYDYSCNLNKGMCEPDINEEIVETCSSSERCDNGECIPQSCSLFNWCGAGYDCIDGQCVPEAGECEGNSDCEDYEYTSPTYCYDDSTVYQTFYSYSCNTNKGLCVGEDGTDMEVEICTSSEECYEGSCLIIECSDSNPCEDGYDCYQGSCVPQGVCHTISDCEEKDCYSAFCDSGTCKYTYNCEEECYSDLDCEYLNSESYSYCGGDDSSDVYVDVYNYTCENKVCKEDFVEKLIEDCDDSTEECEYGECYEVSDECYYDYNCPDDQICNSEGKCVDNTACSSDFDCYDYEECDDSGYCVALGCEYDSDCNGGECSDSGYCVSSDSDCEDAGYWCSSSSNCDGNIMQEYSCSNDIFKCCDTEPPLMTCSEWSGEICSGGDVCTSGGTVVEVSDDLDYDEECCVNGECGEDEGGSDIYCIDEDGTCTDNDYCEDDETEENYLCDYAGQICCVPDEEDKPKRGWILIVILLVLIILAVVGIVFRDKLRTEWIKLKDKLGGKKPKKKFEMPMTMNPNPQGRILPRRILPPGQRPTGPPPQSRFPMRQMGPPATQPSATQKPNQINNIVVPTSPAATKPPQPTFTPKKPELKPKSGELDDVLKKLKEMGKKE